MPSFIIDYTHVRILMRVFINLAQDPDHGNHITVSSCIETMVALELERDGILF